MLTSFLNMSSSYLVCSRISLRAQRVSEAVSLHFHTSPKAPQANLVCLRTQKFSMRSCWVLMTLLPEMQPILKNIRYKLQFKIIIQLKILFSLNLGPIHLGWAVLPISMEISSGRSQQKDDKYNFIKMQQQTQKNQGAVFPSTKAEILQKHESTNIYQNMVLCQFYDKLTTKSKITQLNFMNKNSASSAKKDSKLHSKLLKKKEEDSGIDLTRMQKSLYNTKSVLLPALQGKKKQNQFQERLVVNQTIFIHERVPVGNKTILVDEKWKPKKKLSTPSPLPEVNISPDIKKKHSKAPTPRVGNTTKSLKIVGEGETIQMSRTESITKIKQGFDKSEKKRQSPERTGHSPDKSHSSSKPLLSLTRHKSNEKIGKIQQESYQYPIAQNAESIKMSSEIATIDPSNDIQLNRKKMKIEHMILYYRMKRQKINAEEKSASSKCFTSQALDQMSKIKIKGEQTTTKTKKPSPKKYLVRERSFEELAKIRYSSWKSRDFPFTELPRVEANKLFAYYLGIKEVAPIPAGNYKVYAGDGNNGQLIVRLLKNRGWWVPTEDISEAHLVWTQHPPIDMMKKIQSSSMVKLKQQAAVNFAIPNNALWSVEVVALKKFMKYKNNSFFQACGKLLHPIVYHKIACQISARFKQNRYLKNYQNIKDIVSRNLTTQASLSFQARSTTLFNHVQFSNEIGDKKNLMFHIQKYCELNSIDKNKLIPKTVHINEVDIEIIKESSRDKQFLIENKLNLFEQEEELYILKPGECSNRGNGITIHNNKSSLVQHIARSLISFPENKTYIVQEYIDPLLYQNRKFDIRVWVMYCNNKLWFYKEGYGRTSCKQYSTKTMNKYVHLTNDAVQQYADEYGKYEPGNKVSYQELDRYLKRVYNYHGFYSDICSKMKYLAKILFEAGMLVMGRTAQQFQIFGLDFLIDRKFQVWLIQCNSNPSLETSCSLLNRLVPNMLDNALSVAVDPHFPPNERKIVREDYDWACDKFNFELLSDATLETSYLERIGQDEDYFQYLFNTNPHKLERAKEKKKGKEEVKVKEDKKGEDKQEEEERERELDSSGDVVPINE